MDEGRLRHSQHQRLAGRKFDGPSFAGSITLSVDMSGAFDMVDRALLRQALDPNLV